MTKKFIFTLCVSLIIGQLTYLNAQTYLYKRVMIVKDGQKKTRNDDAHYITFNNNGFYESDKNGYDNGNSNFIKFIKDQNNLHCYFGDGYYGTNYYYFSKDYSRLNIKFDESTIYVYQREYNNHTNASQRNIREKRNYPNTPIITSVTTNPINNNNTLNSNSSLNNSGYTICKECNGTGACKKCKNTGTVFVTGGNINYVTCPSCDGRARCWRCHGRGRY